MLFVTQLQKKTKKRKATKNKKYCIEYRKKYYKLHKTENAIRCKEYSRTHRKQLNEKQKHRRKNNPGLCFIDKLRYRINEAIKFNYKSSHTLQLLGCSIDFLKQHLESKFKSGMTWENYGKWHVDHIKPCASFDLSKPEEQKKCFNYNNLQPLWAVDNLRKGCKIEAKEALQ